jgi:hypothetical protein
VRRSGPLASTGGDVFVTSKLNNGFHRPDDARKAFDITLSESTSEAAPVRPDDSRLVAFRGRRRRERVLVRVGLRRPLVPEVVRLGEYAAVGGADAQVARDHFSSGAQVRGSNLGEAATAYVWGGGRLADAWPAAPGEGEYSRMPTSKVETLLIGGALDFSTPPQVATKELLPYLPNGHEVVLPGLGHTGSFFAEQPEAGSRLINTFFDSGRVDDSLYKPAPVDFTPGLTLTVLAKGIAGAMVGLALLTVLSLLWMARPGAQARTLRTQGERSAAVALPDRPRLGRMVPRRLIVLTTMPGVPLNDELLAAFSVGLPIGLGIDFAHSPACRELSRCPAHVRPSRRCHIPAHGLRRRAAPHSGPGPGARHR